MRSRRLPRRPALLALALGVLVLVLVPGAPGAAAPSGPGPMSEPMSGPVAGAPVGSAAAPAASAAPAGAPAAARSAAWAWPIAPPHPVVRAYLAPPTPYGAGHRGIDIDAADGAPVLAPDDGVVHFAGVVVDRPVLSIEHADGVLSSFEPVTSTLHAGDVVHRGEVIGTVIGGHCASGVCLHLGARMGGEYVNPLVFLGGVPHAVLYPTRSP